MARLGRNFRDGQKKLVGEAYSTIKISDMALYIYLSMGEEEAEGAGCEWDKGSGAVSPKQGREDKGMVPPTKEQFIVRLTNFIYYLENYQRRIWTQKM